MQKYDFNAVRGDTFTGVQFQIIVNAEPLDLTDATIKASFAKSGLGEVVFSWDTTAGQIVITNPTEGRFKFSRIRINNPAGLYDYDIQITLASGVVKTYIQGKFTLNPDVTK